MTTATSSNELSMFSLLQTLIESMRDDHKALREEIRREKERADTLQAMLERAQRNPDPNATVHWGPQTTDEMMLGYVEYCFVSEPRQLSAR